MVKGNEARRKESNMMFLLGTPALISGIGKELRIGRC